MQSKLISGEGDIPGPVNIYHTIQLCVSITWMVRKTIIRGGQNIVFELPNRYD